MLTFDKFRARPRRTDRAVKSLLADVRLHLERLRHISDGHLLDAAEAVRESFARAADGDADPAATKTLALALAAEAVRRTRNVELYDVQFMAALALTENSVAEMATGEGKTYAAFPAAVMASFQGNRSHVVTTNSYLAQRDFELLAPAYQALGLTVGLLGDHNAAPEAKIATYNCDVAYGTGFDFGFDFLRDQAAARSDNSKPLGQDLLEKLRGRREPTAGGANRKSIQTGHQVAIIDEVDHVLLDDAGSPLILCNAPEGEAEDAQAVKLARSLIGQLSSQVHFNVWNESRVKLTDAGLERIHAADVPIPVKQIRRPWAEYMEQALRAELIFRRDVHYLVDEEEIRIIDGSTGRIYSDRSWNDGLHQAIEAKENVRITDERSAIAQVTRQRYFRMYRRLSGMTGTAIGCEKEFQLVYGLGVRRIPPRLPCRRTMLPPRVFSDGECKRNAICEDVQANHRRGRPILIGTRTIRDSELLADRLQARGLVFQMLNGRQDAEEAAVIARAGALGTITIATNLAGRGTDICLPDEVKSLGGLHVIISEPNELERVDRQLVGRCARQGDPGSAQLYASVEDPLIAVHGSWLAGPIRQGARNGELHMDISQRLRSIQHLNERKYAAARYQLMKRDLARESLLSRISGKL